MRHACSLLETTSSAWETTTRRWRLPRGLLWLWDHVDEQVVDSHVTMATRLRLRVSGQVGDFWGPVPKRSFVINFYCHICVLLVKAISMIYICYIKYRMNAACVLAVGDNELGVRDDEDMLLEAAERRGRR